MAVLSNGLHSIESGSIIWRHILNINFNNIYSKSSFDSTAALYADTIHTHTEYKDRTTAESDIDTAMASSFSYDIKYSDELKGIVLLDRTTATYKRLYVESGVLLSEDV